MISQNTIDKVREEVDFTALSKLLVPELKQQGATLKAPCPFPTHSENTASFTVSPSKHMYKCFGCGRGGNDTVKFVMDIKMLDFPAAVKFLCDEYNIELEQTEESEEVKEQQIKRADYAKLNRTVADFFIDSLAQLSLITASAQPMPALAMLKERQLTPDTICAFEIGFAKDDFKALTPYMIDRGYYEQAVELGLIKTKEGTANTYDVYRNRIIFPIHNENGEIIGFGGRKLEKPDADERYQNAPKYLNSKDSVLYKKERVLYGLYQAAPHIRKMGFANLVEGYFDVTGFFQTGLPNTVATCGTALTREHAKLLKRYTDHVVVIGDGDAAGMKANLKAVDILLSEGFKVDICPLPKGEDPDSFSRNFPYFNEEDAA